MIFHKRILVKSLFSFRKSQKDLAERLKVDDEENKEIDKYEKDEQKVSDHSSKN